MWGKIFLYLNLTDIRTEKNFWPFFSVLKNGDPPPAHQHFFEEKKFEQGMI
jgi:hypothetical protein